MGQWNKYISTWYHTEGHITSLSKKKTLGLLIKSIGKHKCNLASDPKISCRLFTNLNSIAEAATRAKWILLIVWTIPQNWPSMKCSRNYAAFLAHHSPFLHVLFHGISHFLFLSKEMEEQTLTYHWVRNGQYLVHCHWPVLGAFISLMASFLRGPHYTSLCWRDPSCSRNWGQKMYAFSSKRKMFK